MTDEEELAARKEDPETWSVVDHVDKTLKLRDAAVAERATREVAAKIEARIQQVLDMPEVYALTGGELLSLVDGLCFALGATNQASGGFMDFAWSHPQYGVLAGEARSARTNGLPSYQRCQGVETLQEAAANRREMLDKFVTWRAAAALRAGSPI